MRRRFWLLPPLLRRMSRKKRRLEAGAREQGRWERIRLCPRSKEIWD